MLAYHSDSAVKDKYLSRIKAHREADELVAGCGWEKNRHVRGCAVGCTFDKYDHSRGPVEIGFPEELMHLEDAIFEGLANGGGDHLAFPAAFLAAVRPGADLSLVWPRFTLWLLTDTESPSFVGSQHETVKDACEEVAGLYREWCETGIKPEKSRFESAAESAARSAARSAWSAARSAESAARTKMRDKLLELLHAA